jgi:hypothetical protein
MRCHIDIQEWRGASFAVSRACALAPIEDFAGVPPGPPRGPSAGYSAGDFVDLVCKVQVRGCTLFTCPCNIYVSSYVTHVPALGSPCVSQDCASGRSGQWLDGSRAEHLSIPIPEKRRTLPEPAVFSLGNTSRGERAADASPGTVLRPALHSIAVCAPHAAARGTAGPPLQMKYRSVLPLRALARVARTTQVRPRLH